MWGQEGPRKACGEAAATRLGTVPQCERRLSWGPRVGPGLLPSPGGGSPENGMIS